MSKALRYLAAARPAAATSLLTFYKESVQALDDKTRCLIQIVTKVSVGTERGLRQYAPKALKAGASKEEILDAVLMAFPAAGLNKVLDAIQVLRDLDLVPEVEGDQKQALPDSVLGNVEDFPLQKMTCVAYGDGNLIVYRASEQNVKVWQSRCPHAKTSLCEGVDHGQQVECRVHNWVFDLESGACTEPDPQGKPGLFPVSVVVEDGLVRVA
ncbi:Carboxymuconolactone decarboxylase [Magnetococcus marinus MC-1]|uniref:Carboxymuconolactone decarboxylase n=1 Tax=Magnetococcus marinus (strain ATCC BAA-1437 / JCM 17883 / MC-1) TaxID=156889 RepID=A0L5T4_MAGMM|nr:Rieske 2Fe-2S domain-containing protein [Magnetococcus marinus]ABK43327.1 Carboxymuconolactone decarboxylase [Magnetococcus marinus MC-1]